MFSLVVICVIARTFGLICKQQTSGWPFASIPFDHVCDKCFYELLGRFFKFSPICFLRSEIYARHRKNVAKVIPKVRPFQKLENLKNEKMSSDDTRKITRIFIERLRAITSSLE